MVAVALYQPEIPQNAGNIIRLCANAGVTLHLIQPFGFVWDDKRLRRAGLDYRDLTPVRRHASWADFLADRAGRLLALTTRGTQRYDQMVFQPDDVLLLGPESRGLPQSVLDPIEPGFRLRIPMAPESRSLNLANACAVVLYEALRQSDFASLK